MKKVLFVAMAALAITGCSQNEEFENEVKKEIGFSSVVGKNSRAAITDNTTFDAFHVYSYNTGTTSFDGTTGLGAAYMDNVGFTGTKGNWTMEQGKGPFYWPATDKMSFFAFSHTVTDYAVAETGFPTFSYTVKALETDQEDIVIANELNKTKADATAGGELTLAFKHILTKINFSVEFEAGFDYTVNTVTISNAKNKGTYTFTVDKGTWGAQEGTASYVYPVTTATVVGNVMDISNSGANALMLMPQDAEGVVITVNYEVVKDNVVYFPAGDKTITLKAGSTWGVGSSVRYKIQLPSGKQDISLDTNVGDWETEGAPTNPE